MVDFPPEGKKSIFGFFQRGIYCIISDQSEAHILHTRGIFEAHFLLTRGIFCAYVWNLFQLNSQIQADSQTVAHVCHHLSQVEFLRLRMILLFCTVW
jgi:hypothetical protein